MKSYLSKFIRYVLPPTALANFLGIRLFLRRTRKSYSQKGEDLIIDSYFRKSAVQKLRVEKGTYLDIGAWHPTAISNTALFSNKGWKGYVVDIDEYKLKFFRFKRGRSCKTILGAVLPISQGEVPVYRFGTPGSWSDIDTLSKDFADFAVNNWGQSGYWIEKIQSMGLNELLERLPHINFLNIDIEGIDFSIVLELDLKRFPIDVVLYEDNTGERFDEIHYKFKEAGYKLILNCHGAVAFGRI